MEDMMSAMSEAARLIAGLDRDLVDIVALSLQVSLSAVLIATLIGMPLGALPGGRPLSRPPMADRHCSTA